MTTPDNPFLTALAGLAHAADHNMISARAERQLIRQAGTYAKNNDLQFDGTLRGVIRMAEHADRLLRDHLARAGRSDNGRAAWRPRITGYDGTTGETRN